MKRCGKQPVFGIFNYVEVTGGVPSILMCDTMCHWNRPAFSDLRNTLIGHYADLCKLHWVILNVVSLNLGKYFIF